MALIVIFAMVVVMAVLNVWLRSWSMREQARVAIKRSAITHLPSLCTPEPGEDRERSATRLERLLDEMAAIARPGTQGRLV